jgi:hypothetical protein
MVPVITASFFFVSQGYGARFGGYEDDLGASLEVIGAGQGMDYEWG